MTRASDIPVSTTCAWITAAIPSSTRVLNSFLKIVAGRAIFRPMEKEAPGHRQPGKSPRGLSVRASRRRSVERPCEHPCQNNRDDGHGDSRHGGVVVFGAHGNGGNQAAKLKIQTRALNNIKSANPRRSFSRPGLISTTPAIAHWQDTKKMTRAMNGSVMRRPVRKVCAKQPSQHLDVVLRIGLLRPLRALCQGTDRPEQDEHHCAID